TFSSTLRSPYRLNRCERYPTESVSRRWSRTGSRSRTRTAPEVAGSSPQISRIVVVFPAPSGPMRPNISPRSTENDSAVTAVGGPYRFVTRSSEMLGIDDLLRQRNLGFDRHARLQHTLPVVDRYLDAVDELRAFVGGLNVARRELRLLRHVGELSGDTCAAGIGEQ